MRNVSHENEFNLHLNENVSKTHFHMKGFTLGLILKQVKRTQGVCLWQYNTQFWLLNAL